VTNDRELLLEMIAIEELIETAGAASPELALTRSLLEHELGG
jgi:hypothetical protein